MDVLFLLIPLAVLFLILAVAFFFWAIKRGQYDDMQSEAMSIVIDDYQDQKLLQRSKVKKDVN